MQLSVIIVNYNVKHFLEQALYSVEKACANLNAEIFVVDNNSVDGSCDMVKQKFPTVKLIENKVNTGFSKANNQAIRESKGQYVLLINPDTLVEEDCFEKVIQFMDTQEDAGAVGVKMIDGAGKFLPESKRGLPTPEVAFYKIFGLSALFPKSSKFGKYHLGYLSNEAVHSVEVLAGAFMMIRKSVLNQIGLLDEDYFMYGEDIDLSYRITKAGYKNYYFPDTTIIHYKGESTKRTSVNYVFTFYRAMVIFANKHYSQSNAKIFSLLIHFAIYLRALFAVLSGFFQKAGLPIADFILFSVGFLNLSSQWGLFKYENSQAYPQNIVLINTCIYTILWMLGLSFANAYNNRKTFLSVCKGVLLGAIGITVFYAFADETYRFSRALIVLGSMGAILLAYTNRVLFYFVLKKRLSFTLENNLKTIIVGNEEEVKRVQELLIQSKSKTDFIGFIGVGEKSINNPFYLGDEAQLDQIVELMQIDELIFCNKDLSAHQIINWMAKIDNPKLMYKIVPQESLFVIGSHSKDTPGDFYTLEFNLALSKPYELRKKRIFDITMAIALMPLIPVLFLINRKPLSLLKNFMEVLIGKSTWVGYAKGVNFQNLPKIKKGILNPSSYNGTALNEVTIQKLNFLYAKDYSVEKDLIILLKSLNQLSN
jgi:GT2 family glycosyltransferase